MITPRRVTFRVLLSFMVPVVMATALHAADVVWVEDSTPVGAIEQGEGEGWHWETTYPPPFSGTVSHTSSLVAGRHQHYFSGATNTLFVGAGERLFAYVYLDPVNRPAQVMLQWNDGWSWEHRAYWGANLIPFGNDGTMSRRYIGPLPETGNWVRLEVAASLVGLEGQTLNGMAFTLFDGQAAWDRAGKATAAPPTGPATMNILGHPPGSKNENYRIQATGFSVSSVPDAFRVYGTAGYQHLKWNAQGQMENLYMGTTPFPDMATIYNRQDCAHTKDPRLWDARCGDAIGFFWKGISCSGSNACQDNERWNGWPGLSNLTPVATPGIWPRSDDFGTANYTPIIDHAVVNRVPLQPQDSTCSKAAGDMIWVADVLPNGAVQYGDNETWNWIDTAAFSGSNTVPFAGRYSHQSVLSGGFHQHYFANSTAPLTINAGDVLVAYVFLDPINPPLEVMLQWRKGNDWEHRAFWGANRINLGADGTASKRYKGALPQAGQWVRLEVPANEVGLVNTTINGMAFTLYGGRATWDHAGKRTAAAQTPCPPKTGRSQLTTFHAYNPDDFATGAANAKVVQHRYPDGTSRWFMAFNSMMHYVSVTNGNPKTNASDWGRKADDNWRVLWATSPDGVAWSIDPQVLFRSTSEGEAHYTGLLLTDMIVDNGYFYALFQDLTTNLSKPHSYLARARVHPTNSTSNPGYDQAQGWSIASYPIVGGQYTWQRVPALGSQINLDAFGAVPVMPARINVWGGYVKQASMARIFKSATPGSESRIFGVTADGPIVQLWSTTDLSTPFEYASDVVLDPSITLGANGWEFGFTRYVDNFAATPRLIGSSLQVWVAESSGAGTNFVLLTRRNAQITGW